MQSDYAKLRNKKALYIEHGSYILKISKKKKKKKNCQKASIHFFEIRIELKI